VAVRAGGLALLVEGGRTALHELPRGIEMPDDAVAVRMQNPVVFAPL
jgi:nitrogen fixation protein